MDLKPGSRLKSLVCDTELIVVKAPDGDVDITCGGAPMADPAEAERNGDVSADATDGTALGKRYVNEDESLEVLCTKPGDGSLALGGTPLGLKEAKPLPASD
ncbi:hypothetical protein [Candidatus Poriferisocius sp.]|uniref:hypothetical protein n=1 Tax=Candidatus Poriferisocius sp. TaxID=3101276 RepID=UPI003B52EFBD